MTHQLHSVHDEGREPLAILWASEPQIYGRFGYGLATRHLSLTVPRDPEALLPSAPRDESLRLRVVDPSDWKLTADVYARVRELRPGAPARDELWWKHAVQDIVAMRDGKSALRCVVAEDETGVRGYARYATKDMFEDWVSSGKVMVREVMAVDAAASAALYRYLCDLDLMGTTHLWNVPVDDPLLLWLQNPRKAKPVLGDSLYVRLVDLDRSLRARTYATPVDVVLEVTDDLCPWNAGRWRLTAGPDRETTCERTTDAADLALGVVDLGAVYLGGTSLHELAMAGWVSELRAGTLAAAATAFAHTPAPWNPAVF
jgi:predicted acetyltransferase